MLDELYDFVIENFDTIGAAAIYNRDFSDDYFCFNTLEKLS